MLLDDAAGNGEAEAVARACRGQAGRNACEHLLPPSPAGPSPAEVQRGMTGMTNFTRCMRGLGVSDWPDPYLDVGRPTFDIHAIDYQAPRISRAIHECRHLMPGSTEPRMRSTLLAQ